MISHLIAWDIEETSKSLWKNIGIFDFELYAKTASQRSTQSVATVHGSGEPSFSPAHGFWLTSMSADRYAISLHERLGKARCQRKFLLGHQRQNQILCAMRAKTCKSSNSASLCSDCKVFKMIGTNRSIFARSSEKRYCGNRCSILKACDVTGIEEVGGKVWCTWWCTVFQ